MFIKKIFLKNVRAFREKELGPFNAPNGKIGSGLNIFIGENATGKTSILEAINYLGMSSLFSREKLDITDFNNPSHPIIVIAKSDKEIICKSSIDFYKQRYRFKCKGVYFEAKIRDKKEPNKLLSSQFSTRLLFGTSPNNSFHYISTEGDLISNKQGDPKNVDSRDLIFENKRIEKSGINIFYFDKNRTRQLKRGQFKTTFQRIIEDITWKYRQQLIGKNRSELFNTILSLNSKILTLFSTSNSRLSEELAVFFDDQILKQITLDIIRVLDPFKNSFFSLPLKDGTQQIPASKLGSGIEMILTLLLLKNISGKAKGSIIYLIDEPELHLHPKAQIALEELLLEESRNKQIFISTHSPYMFKSSLNKGAKIFIFKKQKNSIEIALFTPQSDEKENTQHTWGEINWHAFNLPTIEFFNELYGDLFIEYTENTQTSKSLTMYTFDKYLQKRLGISDQQLKTWIGKKPKKPPTPKKVTFITFLRNYIHHPENTENQLSKEKFTEYLKEAIKDLLKLKTDTDNE